MSRRSNTLPIVLPALVALTLLAWSPARSGAVLTPETAPEWDVSRWINRDPGPLSSIKKKVVVVHFFQMECEACTESSIPAVNRWFEKWSWRPDIEIVSILSAFEMQERQTPALLEEFVLDHGMQHPVGIDRREQPDDEETVSMQRFDIGGTPHLAIVDSRGDLVFSHFGVLDIGPIESYIGRLLKDGDNPLSITEPSLQPRAKVSGRWSIAFEPKSNSCGAVEAFEADAEMEISRSRVLARFPGGLFGLNELMAPNDRKTGAFAVVLKRRLRGADGRPFSLDYRIDGSIDDDDDPPTLEMRLRITREQAGQSCSIELDGKGKRGQT